MRGLRPWMLLLLPALGLMLGGLREPLGGSHLFRQSHVAANIDMFVADGLSLRPATYNEDAPYSAFDFPLYQLIVAGLCRLAPLDTLVAARLVSLGLFLLVLRAVWALLCRAGVGQWTAAVSTLLVAFSSLNLFYFQAPMVDGLAVLLALLALEQYITGEKGWLTAALGFSSTLIKSPVYLPVFVAIMWDCFRREGWRGLVRGRALAQVAAAAGGVAAFKLYWTAANGSTSVLSDWERKHYFGTFAERFSVTAWRPVVADFAWFSTNPLVVVFVIVGLVWWWRRGRAPVLGGLAVGCAVTLVVFFGKFPPHNYYQLPLVFPAALFGAQGLRALLVWGRRRKLRRLAFFGVCVVLLVSGMVGCRGFGILAEGGRTSEILRSRGQWIAKHSQPSDYVVYVFDGTADHWNPAFLYFAKRRGFNLPMSEVTAARLSEVAQRAQGRFERVLVFTNREEVEVSLEQLGGQRLATGKWKGLYVWPAAR